MEYNFNTSQLVRDALPEVTQRPNKNDIQMPKYDRDTRDRYENVRRASQDIWDGQRPLFLPTPHPQDNKDHVDVDLILHLGMVALGWKMDQFRFETVARRDGYELAGDDGQYVDSAHRQKLGLPEILATLVDVEAAWRNKMFP